jgi:hypothetical protein
MTLVLNASNEKAEQAIKQLEDVPNVWAVINYTGRGIMERELLLVKVSTKVGSESRALLGTRPRNVPAAIEEVTYPLAQAPSFLLLTHSRRNAKCRVGIAGNSYRISRKFSKGKSWTSVRRT